MILTSPTLPHLHNEDISHTSSTMMVKFLAQRKLSVIVQYFDLITFLRFSESSWGFVHLSSIKYYIIHIYYNSPPVLC